MTCWRRLRDWQQAGVWDLQRVIEAWPRLSESVQNRIAGLVESAELSRDD